MLDGERLHRHHRAFHDRRAVAAARHLTRPVPGPEGVDDFRAFVAVVLALIKRDGERVEASGHRLVRRQMRPHTFLAFGAVAAVVRHDLRLARADGVGDLLLVELFGGGHHEFPTPSTATSGLSLSRNC